MQHRHKHKLGATCRKSGLANRLVPMAVLAVYSVYTVLCLPKSSPLSLVADSERGGGGREKSEPLRTHLPAIENTQLEAREEIEIRPPPPLCSALINGDSAWSSKEDTADASGSGGGVLCCDRSHYRSDVCYLRGDIRTDQTRASVLLVENRAGSPTAVAAAPAEAIQPYTRKFEDSVMRTIDKLRLVRADAGGAVARRRRCDVEHSVPAVVFSTGGYTGNVYHEFSDGLIPLYVTAGRFAGEVALVVLDYHSWWLGRYGDILAALTNHRIVDYWRDRRVHCFPEMIVGLRIHGELFVDPKFMPNGEGIRDFQALVDRAYASAGATRAAPPPRPCLGPKARPKLIIFMRKQTRVLLNLSKIMSACRRAGFHVQTLNVKRSTPVRSIYQTLSTTDVMVAVHGAAVTHFLFLRPGSVLLQIVPVGLDWAADAFYGSPALSLGLEYLEYRVSPEESSLAEEYGLNSTVLQDPSIISSKGWWEMKKVYMDRQNVTIDVKRFASVLQTARQRLANVTCHGSAANDDTSVASEDELATEAH